jgi:hypothetical protein
MQETTTDQALVIERAENMKERTGKRHIAFRDPELGGFLAVPYTEYMAGKYAWVNPLWVCFDTGDPSVHKGYTERLPILEY